MKLIPDAEENYLNNEWMAVCPCGIGGEDDSCSGSLHIAKCTGPVVSDMRRFQATPVVSIGSIIIC